MDVPLAREREAVPKIEYHLTGFTQEAGVRTYAFEGRSAAERVAYTVQVDLALIPAFGIRIQELPLLCRELLEQRTEPPNIQALIFTEQHMRGYAQKIATAREAAEHRKKAPQPGATANPAPAPGWRNG